MKIILKTLVYHGEQTEVHDHDMYGKVLLFPKGTKREVKVLLIPSFKIVTLIQEARIEEGSTPTDGIRYAFNSWVYEEDTLQFIVRKSKSIYVDNQLLVGRLGSFGDLELDMWDEKNKRLFLKSK
jgi:hypothetical protein